MSEQQPQWVFPPTKRRRAGRVVLLVSLIVVAVAVAVAALFFSFSQDAPRPTPSASQSASASSSATASATPSPTDSPSTPAETPTAAPTVEPTDPVVEVPDLGPFGDAVGPRLNDAETGLGFIAETSGAEAAGYADDLIVDAQILSDEVAPESIATAWRAQVDAYLSSLSAVKNAATSGGDLAGALDQARADVASLRALAGL